MLQVENKRNVIVCAGCGQTGKSTFALRYLLNAPIDFRFIFDPEEEYAQRLGLAPARTAHELSMALMRGWVLFDPHDLFPGRRDEAFAFFCEWTFDKCSALPGKKMLGVDEVWKYCSPQSIPPELATVCQTARKRGLGLLVNTQHPTKLNGSILSEVSEFVCFRLQYERALTLAAERGFNPDQVQALPDLHFISRTDQGGELRGAIEL